MPRKQRRARPGSGSVYWSDPQGRYIGEITLGRDERGVRIRKVLVGPRGDKSDDARLGVKDRLGRLQRKRRPGKARLASGLRLGEYLDQWLETKGDLSDSARANYGWAIEGHLRPALGNMKLRDLDRDRLRKFFAGLPLGDGGKGKVRTVLRAALADAVTEHDLLSVNPAAGSILPKKQGLLEVAVWNADQAKRFLKAAKGTEHFPLFLLAIVGALGPAELFGIRWKDVDLNGGRVAIVANLTEVEGRLILKETKTPSRRRSVALPRVALRALKARHKAVHPSPNDFVFTAPEGGGIRRTTFRSRVWLPLVKKAKVPVVTLYGLRHSAASLMAAMGVPLLVASRALGHSNIRTTANTYTHLFEESQREVASKFDDFLSGL
ncbi:MAG: tyrosine-type recombinase/integrase [Candidatus Cybelea sp.]